MVTIETREIHMGYHRSQKEILSTVQYVSLFFKKCHFLSSYFRTGFEIFGKITTIIEVVEEFEFINKLSIQILAFFLQRAFTVQNYFICSNKSLKEEENKVHCMLFFCTRTLYHKLRKA